MDECAVKRIGTFLSLAAICVSLSAKTGNWQLPQAGINHVLIYGQSLSTGYQSVPPLSLENYGGNLMLGSQVWVNMDNEGLTSFHLLVSNVAAFYRMSYEESLVALKSDPASCECPVTGFVNCLKYLLDKEDAAYRDKVFLASSCGAPGKSIELLSKDCRNPSPVLYNVYRDAIKAAKVAAKSIDKTLVCPALLWMQGESNYASVAGQGLLPGLSATPDKEEYKAFMRRMSEDMIFDVCTMYEQEKPPLFISYQTTGQYTVGNRVGIGMAQLELGNDAASGIICAGPVYQMTDRGAHLDPNGYRWFGELMAKVYFKTVIRGERWLPLQPVKLTKGPDYILIDYYVPFAPLVLDTNTLPDAGNYGFMVYDNGVLADIKRVELAGDTQIKITVRKNFTGEVGVSYAGQGRNGHGNVRDSDPFEGFAVYEKLPDAQQPVYEPIGEDGNRWYGKKYPLQNYSVAFYYRIARGETAYTVESITSGVPENRIFHTLKVWVRNGNVIVADAGCEMPYRIADVSGKILAHGFLKMGKNEIGAYTLSHGVYLFTVPGHHYRIAITK